MTAADFIPGPIADVIWKPLAKFHDPRGWLCELYRQDELPEEFWPVMAYVSVTEPGVVRGPHEHVEQADYFCFWGPSTFALHLWDARPHSATFRHYQVEEVGAERPMAVVVPPGVVHAYRNVGSEPGLVFNGANRLYKGSGRAEPVDEIRHEHDPQSPFRVE
ncbi:MAG TPA: dTDP-4-dehydrorhamnose 3,5-epimerase family protein [Gemmatales bacterium]|nr:dTDP-4-dehydrorhamnose 3,5-epimerase family protein [Gemmatales bacterium]HMP58201.1 dTDP-4-dehydrorhamnose 3,5-epimerase family protein [Gemmatales bacterium]